MRGAYRLLGAFTLVGLVVACGGGSGSGGDSPPGEEPPPDGGTFLYTSGPVSGSVDLPAGLALGLDTLRLSTVFGEYAVDAAGQWTGEAFTGAPSHVQVLREDGRTVLTGWLGTHENRLSARTTAEVLLYFRLLLFGFSHEDHVRALEALLEQETVLEAVAAAIREAYAGGAESLEDVLPLIAETLNEATSTLRDRVSTFGMSVDPTGGHSGAEVVQGDAEQIQVINHYRRRLAASVRRVAYLEADGKTWQYPTDPVVIHDVSGTAGLGNLLSTIWGGISGNGAYAPVTSGPFPTPIDPADALRVQYTVHVLGAGISRGDAWDQLDEDEFTRLVLLWTRTAILDLFLPLLTNTVLPLKGETSKIFDDDEVASQLSDLVSLVNEALDAELKSKLESGDVKGIFVWFVNKLLDASYWKDEVVDLISLVFEKAAQKLPQNWTSKLQFEVLNLAAIDAGLTAIDTVVQMSHIGLSSMVEEWTVDVMPTKVSLTPDRGTILLGDGEADVLAFTAIAQDYPGGDPSLRYVWTTSGKLGTLSDSDGNTGTTFESLQRVCSYVASSTTQGGEDTVDVEVYRMDGADRVFVGKDQGTVYLIGLGPEIHPKRKSLRPGQTKRFHVRFPGIPPNQMPDETRLRYVWDWSTSLGFVGDVRGAPVVPGESAERAAYVDYRALDNAPDGSRDTLSVEVFVTVDGNEVSMGKAEAEIRIENEPSIIEGTFRAHVFPNEDGVGGGVYADVVWPAHEGATRYVMTGYGGYDWAFYQYGPITRSVDPEHISHDQIASMPAGEIWQGLSAVWGGDVGEGVAYMKGRFLNGWIWEVEIIK